MSTAGAADAGVATALWHAAWVLVALLVAKLLAPLPVVGPMALTGAAFVQLYLPMRHCEQRDLPYAAVGLDLTDWRRELGLALGVAAVVLPVYALGWHWLVTAGADAADAWGWPRLAAALPRLRWAAHWPEGAAGWQAAALGAGALVVTHVAGVALPEETFYRGYLQPLLAARWPPRWRPGGSGLGRAAALSCALFALGHYLGEWHPVRLLPFFPGLLFAWVRGRGRTIVAPTALHAACNLCSAGLLGGYR